MEDRAKIREWRLALGLSQTKAARRAKIRQQTWSNIELGLQHPHPNTLAAIAKALRVSLSRLVEGPPEASSDDETQGTHDGISGSRAGGLA